MMKMNLRELEENLKVYSSLSLIMEVKYERWPLTFLAIEHFRVMFNIFTRKRHDLSEMQSVFFAYDPKRFQMMPINRNHMQIIAFHHYENNCVQQHCILSRYVAANKEVLLYDSDYSPGCEAPEMVRKVLQRLYPNMRYRFDKPATTQPDEYSCAVFVMAYIGMLLNGLDPEKEQIEVLDPLTGRQTGALRDNVVENLYIVKHFNRLNDCNS